MVPQLKVSHLQIYRHPVGVFNLVDLIGIGMRMETQLKIPQFRDFNTKNGRKVQVGWGFYPDIEIAAAKQIP